MTTVLLTIHFLISLALVISVLLQRSEGGALGIGGSGPGSLMSGRSATNMLTRTTGFLGAAFFIMSILLTVIPNWGKGTVDSEIIGQEAEITAPVIPAAPETEKPVQKSEPE
ncbi:Protein translocase membrane subunit SecG [hydrothermal vent metagenome]|uniref:Protein translocase membrane subunit SecG n=1 Tax=hydrothermal vent metagenome TaxID=652676 RepID=A0A3B0S418_9ZZZZ